MKSRSFVLKTHVKGRIMAIIDGNISETSIDLPIW